MRSAVLVEVSLNKRHFTRTAPAPLHFRFHAEYRLVAMTPLGAPVGTSGLDGAKECEVTLHVDGLASFSSKHVKVRLIGNAAEPIIIPAILSPPVDAEALGYGDELLIDLPEHDKNEYVLDLYEQLARKQQSFVVKFLAPSTAAAGRYMVELSRVWSLFHRNIGARRRRTPKGLRVSEDIERLSSRPFRWLPSDSA